MPSPPFPACRIFAILARDGRSAVVFRRGPSRRVLALRWWLGSDRIEPGQWLHGRIYERRCDLSHDGELMIYFAAKWRRPIESWTAVSRPPWLTALALWPKGDAWGGGGLFLSAARIGLNHGADRMALADGHKLPMRIKVVPAGEWAGHGEDNPIEQVRMLRDGWSLIERGQAERYGSRRQYAVVMSTPERYERAQPGSRGRIRLRRDLKAIGKRDGPWYVEDFSLLDEDGRCLRLVADASWADWESGGDLLLAHDGRLYRLRARHAARQAAQPLADARLVADLRELADERREAPVEATRWP